jgi:hypothetical protein
VAFLQKIRIELCSGKRGTKAIPLPGDFDLACHPVDVSFIIPEGKERLLPKCFLDKSLA